MALARLPGASAVLYLSMGYAGTTEGIGWQGAPALAVAFVQSELSITELSAPDTILPGVPFDLHYTVRNRGDGVAVGTFTCAWGEQDRQTILLGLFADDPLSPAQHRDVTVSVTWAPPRRRPRSCTPTRPSRVIESWASASGGLAA